MTKYAPLSEFLNHQPLDEIRLGFGEVEKILGAPLPRSAYEHQAWWANNPEGHSHSRAWHDAGWKTENLNIAGRAVSFRRVRKLGVPTTSATTATASDLWGALAGTVTIIDDAALTAPSGEIWNAEKEDRA
jgi:hypothetical protein